MAKKNAAPRARDKYDDQIDELKAHPELIPVHWMHGVGIFQFVGEGCLTMVKADDYKARTPALTKRIRADRRIPKRAPTNRTSERTLQVLANYQREFDEKYGEDR